MNFFTRTLNISIVLLFTACTSTVSLDLRNYPIKINLEDSSTVPTTEFLHKDGGVRIVVINIDDHLNKISKDSKLGFVIGSELNRQLVHTKQVQVIKYLDENKPTFLSQLKRGEFVNKKNIPLETSDYLLTGQIVEATFDKHSTPPKSKVGGSISGSIGYRTCIKGTINLFKLPSITVQDEFGFEECSFDIMTVLNPRYLKEQYPELVRESISKAIEKVISKMNQYFVAKGYIYAMRSNSKGEKVIKTTLNRSLGAIEGTTVEIIRMEKDKDTSIRKNEYTEIPIGLGTITNLITDDYSFIKVNDLDSKIKIGDVVKVIK